MELSAYDYIEALHALLGSIMGCRANVDETTFLTILGCQKTECGFAFMSNTTRCSGESLLEAYCMMNNEKYIGCYDLFVLDNDHLEISSEGMTNRICVSQIL